MEDYRLDQSGQEVQDILNGAAMQSDLTAETERATGAEQTLQDNIDAEETRAQGAEGTLQDNIDAEESRAKAAEKQNADDIDAIEEKIPSGASTSNPLATEEYVADAVATATATFRGTYNLVSDLHLNVTATEQQIAAALAGAISTADNNDYCFILVPTSSETPTEIKEIDRYKFNGTAWAFEYKLNNSGFNAAQWAAINSGITSGDVAKLAALPTNAQLTTLLAGLQSDIDGEETRAKGAEGTLQDNIDAEETRAKAAEKQNADDIDAIEAVIPESASSENKVATESEINSLSAAIEAILLLIPSAATSLNKLADKAFVNSSIATATATFRGTYNLVNDLGLTTSATHAQIATALAGAILTADNNDYAFVQIPTSDAMPTEIAKTERYKFNGTAWEYEYDLNNSGFTADQWAAINSGITQALVTKLSALPTNAELTTELGTLTSGINAINQKIPSAASQANKLVDTAAMESYIVQVLDVLTISYNVTSTDGHVTLSIEQVDGKVTSVTLTTSDIASAAALNLKASQADLTALASRVTTAEGNITSLGGRMTTAEGNITSLGGRMTTAESNITSLGGRVSTNETDIANLQQLYNDLQQSKPVPVTALPSTGQQQGVIYRLAGTTSYSDYMWNGSTWVLMATYDNAIDPRPKKASQNLVTSGGVFDNMGALDVSELNATENPHTLAQYTDLSAALAAIPTDYQKGGMSIKFVQSSDNKYVQFFCTADEFTTDIASWKGVDIVPTENSHNLVESGGVVEKFDQVIGRKANYTANTGINIRGQIITGGDYNGTDMSEKIFVSNGDRVTYFTGEHGESSDRIGIYASDGTFLDYWPGSTTPRTIDIEEPTASYILFCYNHVDKNSAYVQGRTTWKPKDKINGLQDEIDSLQMLEEKDLAEFNLIKDYSNKVLHGEKGTVYKISGDVGSVATITRETESTEREGYDMQVSEGEQFDIYGNSGYSSSYPLYTLLDENGVITRKRAPDSATSVKLTIASNEKRLIITILPTNGRYIKRVYGYIEDIKSIEDKTSLIINPMGCIFYRSLRIGDVPKDYFVSSLEDFTFGNGSTLTSAVYDKYDELIGNVENINDRDQEATNGYITRKKIGVASDNQPLLAYEFKPTLNNTSINKIPKIIIVASQHGFEKGAAFATYNLMKNMVNATINDAFMNYLRGNVHFVIIPVANPSGFDASTYKNSNGVNLNRNWPVPNWTGNDNPSSSDYSGVEPLDQPETLAIYNYITTNHSDAVLGIDFHTNGGNESKTPQNLNWIDINYPATYDYDDFWQDFIKIALVHNRNMTQLFRLLYSTQSGQTNTDTIGNVTYRTTTDATVGWLDGCFPKIMGICGLTFEGFNKFINDTGYSTTTKKACCELLGNFIKTFLLGYEKIFFNK